MSHKLTVKESVGRTACPLAGGHPSITINDLAKTLHCHVRTIRRREAELGLHRVKGRGNQTAYSMPSAVNLTRMSAMLSAMFRRDVTVRKTRIPHPSLVVPALEEANHGPLAPDKLACVYLTLAKFLNVTLHRGDPETIIEIGSRRIEDLVGKTHAPRTIKLLMQAGLLQRKQGYIPGERCFAYQLSPVCFEKYAYIQLPWPVLSERVDPSPSAYAIPRGSPHRQKVLSRMETDLAKLAFHPDIDIRAVAKKHADAKLEEYRQQPKKRKKKYKLSDKARAHHALLSVISAYERFTNLPRTLSPKENSWRVYHPVANMQRTLREYLTYDSQPLSTIDIKCCQPFLLGQLFHENRDAYDLAPQEIKDYLALTQSGGFYEWLQKEMGISNITRDKLKETVFRDLLFGKDHYWFTPAYEAFSRRFPSLGNALKYFHKDTDNLALRLQRKESEIMFGHVLPALQAAFPSHPIITVHDAAMVPLSIAEKGKNEFTASVSPLFPIPPSISTSHHPLFMFPHLSKRVTAAA